MTTRRLRTLYCPVGARCALCGLDASTGGYGAIKLKIEHAPPGEPLAVFNRSSWLCDPCVDAIAGAEESK